MDWKIILILIVLALLVKSQNLLGKLKGGSERLGLSDTRIMIAAGIVVFNLISWAMIPWWWKIITYTWWVFAIFNVGFGAVLYLRTLKAKNKKGEETEKDHPTAFKLASIITIVLVVGLVTTAGNMIQSRQKDSGGSILSRTPVTTLLGTVDVPTDKWSGEVNTTGHRKVCWGRIDTTKGGVCEVMLDKDPKMVFPIKTPTYHAGLKILQFRCSETGARVEVSSSN